jgi:hypothetical protein
MSEPGEVLKVTEHNGYTEIEVLQPCSVHSSVDSITWMHCLDNATAGTVFRDFGAPKGKRRKYRACVDGQITETYKDGYPEMRLQRRLFPDAVRYVLRLPLDCDDSDVLAELGVVRYRSDRWRERVKP